INGISALAGCQVWRSQFLSTSGIIFWRSTKDFCKIGSPANWVSDVSVFWNAGVRLDQTGGYTLHVFGRAGGGLSPYRSATYTYCTCPSGRFEARWGMDESIRLVFPFSLSIYMIIIYLYICTQYIHNVTNGVTLHCSLHSWLT